MTGERILCLHANGTATEHIIENGKNAIQLPIVRKLNRFSAAQDDLSFETKLFTRRLIRYRKREYLSVFVELNEDIPQQEILERYEFRIWESQENERIRRSKKTNPPKGDD